MFSAVCRGRSGRASEVGLSWSAGVEWFGLSRGGGDPGWGSCDDG
jgi:hypothetical protein